MRKFFPKNRNIVRTVGMQFSKLMLYYIREQ